MHRARRAQWGWLEMLRLAPLGADPDATGLWGPVNILWSKHPVEGLQNDLSGRSRTV